MFLYHVGLYGFDTACHKTIVEAAQSHAVVLEHVIVERLVICVPEVTEWADCQCDLVLAIGAVVHVVHQCPLTVQAPQTHEAGSAETIRIIISD